MLNWPGGAETKLVAFCWLVQGVAQEATYGWEGPVLSAPVLINQMLWGLFL